MDKYKREHQVANEEINSFKEIEVNKILTKIETKEPFFKQYKRFLPATIISFVAIIAIVIVGMVNQPDDGGNYFINVTQLNAQEFLVESTSSDVEFYFYYRAYIVYENPLISYNETFDYRVRYTEVPDEIKDSISVDLDAIQIGSYRYFLRIEVEDDIRYIESDVFPGLSKDKTIEGLDIIDFKQDFIDIYELIEQYPPIFNGENERNVPTYLPNDAVDAVEDQRLVDNYKEYVSNYYEDASYYGDGNGEKRIITVSENTVIVLDENNEVDYTTKHSWIYGGTHKPYDELNDLILDSFEFIDHSTGYGLTQMFQEFKYTDDLLEGRFASANIDNDIYSYVIIYLEESDIDLSMVTNVVYTYQLLGFLDDNAGLQTLELETFIHQNYLLVPPHPFFEEESETVVSSGYSYFNIDFYDDAGTLIYSVEVTGNNN